MSAEDRERWDRSYADADPEAMPRLPARFERFAAEFAQADFALEIACGAGRLAVWLATQHAEVLGVDVSPVAVEHARALAEANGVAGRCRFEVADLDDGLPVGEPVDLLVCHLFREPALYPSMIDRVRPGGILALAVLSQVDSEPGRFRAPAGELMDTFGSDPRLDVLDHCERDGVASIITRRH